MIPTHRQGRDYTPYPPTQVYTDLARDAWRFHDHTTLNRLQATLRRINWRLQGPAVET